MWIQGINAACQQHGLNYSRFIMCLNRSNVNVDRKILSDLAIHEPYSFKAVCDEIMRQNEFEELDLGHTSEMTRSQYGTTLAEALAVGKMK